ncbi:MAG: hypothetical protein PSN04_09250 [Methyloprofundus sp.]|nr:hypothetical protein [Methyloprofundus sp.]
MGCCDDPKEPVKINRADLARVQEQYGNLLRDFLTGDPEKLMLQQLSSANVYLIELAALNAHYLSVRKQAISLLDKKSLRTLQTIIDREQESELAIFTQQHIEALENKKGFFDKFL